MKVLKYSGAGNRFVVFDGRNHDMSDFRRVETISRLCRENGTDGLMILDNSENYDFKMEFYNPDGSGGMMCGNGGRCIVALAESLGIEPSGREYMFEAADGVHTAQILSKEGDRAIVRLHMIDVKEIRKVLGGWFLNTGTRQFIKFVDDVEAIDIMTEGKELRWDKAFAPEGTNVCFVQNLGGGELKIRTFEKGVEGETLACGTGITATAIAAYNAGIAPAKTEGRRVSYILHARIDDLSVDFIPVSNSELIATDVHLTGPAEPYE